MKTIDSKKYYSLNEVIENNYLPWIKSIRTLVRWIECDRLDRNVLNVNIIGEGNGKRYYIKGSNLIKFIVLFEDGSLTLQRKGGEKQ